MNNIPESAIHFFCRIIMKISLHKPNANTIHTFLLHTVIRLDVFVLSILGILLKDHMRTIEAFLQLFIEKLCEPHLTLRLTKLLEQKSNNGGTL